MTKSKRTVAVQLRVAEAHHRDIGKGRVRLDKDTLEVLGIEPGNSVEIMGKKATVGTAWPADAEDETLSIIRMDGMARKNAGISLNEFVTVRRIESQTAIAISLTPIGSKVASDREFAEFVRNRLKGMAISAGDEVSVMVLGSPLLFKAQRVRPKGCVSIDQSTMLSILLDSAAGHKVVHGVAYEEIGGLGEEIRRLREIVELPLRHKEIFQKLGVEPPNGILLYGPPGCGKTLLARALANECDASFYSINGPEIMNKYYGETEGKLRDLFKEARDNSPSIVFIDEIDVLAPRREEAFGDVEKRVVGQLLALMDGVLDRGDVVVIGATNRPESIDPALRRPGRFDRELQIGVPNAQARHEILQIHTRGMPLSEFVDLEKIAADLYGYTGADLRALCRESALKALRRQIPQIDLESGELPPGVLDKIEVTLNDFKEATKDIVPSAMREFYIESPKVSWVEVGGLESVKRTIFENVVWPIKDPSRFEKAGINPAKGLLLYGPPGCGKTLLARALATESGANLIMVRGPEVLSKWLGESERAIREMFKKAKASAPCIVLLDEIDCLAVVRSDSSQRTDQVLSQLLTEMDSTSHTSNIFVVGATNRPDLVDLSLLRPGRLDLFVYVPPPDEAGRREILKIHTSKMPLSSAVSIEHIASQCKGYSGADLQSVCRTAAIEAMRRNSEAPLITHEDFAVAISQVRPMISSDLENWFSGLEKKI
ncbi:MAG: CDC48 family AAA ATPase, partial [Thaumarchaeota archaeon]|nr:CDC48 family AAA ATPase [Nitrososphaerota archaeon]